MDDFNVTTLKDCRNEYTSLIMQVLTPCIYQGIQSIFDEANRLCIENDEDEKYLMTFQNFLRRVPKWNNEIIQKEVMRIQEESSCSYLEDLITCVHISQLKILTSMRVSSQQKKIDIDIPSMNNFIHMVYINASRKIYKNVYLYEMNVSPLTKQKNMRELELLIRESIIDSIRSSIPVEEILKSYLSSTQEKEDFDIREEIIEEPVEEEIVVNETVESTSNENQANMSNFNTAPITTLDKETFTNQYNNDNSRSATPQENTSGVSPVIQYNTNNTNNTNSIDSTTAAAITANIVQPKMSGNVSFNDTDSVGHYDKSMAPTQSVTMKTEEHAPKTIERLEEISRVRAEQEALYDDDEEEEEDEEQPMLKFLDDTPSANLDIGIVDLDVKPQTSVSQPKKVESLKIEDAPLLQDIVQL